MGDHAPGRRRLSDSPAVDPALEEPGADQAPAPVETSDEPPTEGIFPPRAVEAAALDDARRLFAHECRFVAGAMKAPMLPPDTLPEIAFAGRSNVGKSSLVNALTARRTLARTSQTPGRTQQLNFFDLDGRLMLVDLPGYGHASASKTAIKDWSALVRQYLRGRAALRRACVLIDSRHGLKDLDRALMNMLDAAAVSYQIVLTKTDKLSPGARLREAERITVELARHTAAHPEVHITSSDTGAGIPALRAALASLALPE